MSESTPDLMTAPQMAKSLGAPDKLVKAALERLGIEPAARKGCCRYYTPQDLDRIREDLQA